MENKKYMIGLAGVGMYTPANEINIPPRKYIMFDTLLLQNNGTAIGV